ncbi:MAG: DUF6515 family protein [Akkermansiaceae bacterium]
MKFPFPLLAATLGIATVAPTLTSCVVAARPPARTTVIETRPAPGAYVAALPPGHTTLTRRGVRYYLVNGIYYRQSGSGFVVVPSPL